MGEAGPQEFAATIRRVAAGDYWLDPPVAGQVIRALGDAPKSAKGASELLPRLTPREREVLHLMASGLSVPEIRRPVRFERSDREDADSSYPAQNRPARPCQAVVVVYQGDLMLPGA
jgi:hypothetical protein